LHFPTVCICSYSQREGGRGSAGRKRRRIAYSRNLGSEKFGVRWGGRLPMREEQFILTG